MTILTRDQVPLEDEEIRLVKGLWKHHDALKLNQQRIIAYFSFPHRTVHHNVISAITRGKAGTSDRDYPPADRAACDFFLAHSNGTWEQHLFARTLAAGFSASHRPNLFSFAYHYHPVGQGLFCSGSFKRPDHDPYRWVYDCGTERGTRTARSTALVSSELASLAAEVGTGRLDLVTLSHFDEDHLSGMLELLRTFEVGTLLLPYLTPWERLIVALSEEAEVGSDLLDFLIAPTAYLLGRPEFRIEKILFVPSGGEGPAIQPFLGPEDGPPDADTIGRVPAILIKDHALEPEQGHADGFSDSGLADPRVRVLDRGGWILIAHAWEFVPYNDSKLSDLATEDFKDAARGYVATLLDPEDEAQREDALEALTKLYDDRFKSPGSKDIDARRRNLISLFLYAGPIGGVQLLHPDVTVPRRDLDTLAGELPRFWTHSDRFGQMFTGDGFLRTVQQQHDFLTFYGAGNRLARGAVFQVMHHGSEKNWKRGIAGKIDPIVSLFCSDPLGKNGHPSAPVVSDFASSHRIQVDGVHGWRVEGRYRFL